MSTAYSAVSDSIISVRDWINGGNSSIVVCQTTSRSMWKYTRTSLLRMPIIADQGISERRSRSSGGIFARRLTYYFDSFDEGQGKHAVIVEVSSFPLPSETDRLLRRFDHMPQAGKVFIPHIGPLLRRQPGLENIDSGLAASGGLPFAPPEGRKARSPYPQTQ